MNIPKPIEIERLIKCRYSDNLEFLQWFKKFFDSHNNIQRDYDPIVIYLLNWNYSKKEMDKTWKIIITMKMEEVFQGINFHVSPKLFREGYLIIYLRIHQHLICQETRRMIISMSLKLRITPTSLLSRGILKTYMDRLKRWSKRGTIILSRFYWNIIHSKLKEID